MMINNFIYNQLKKKLKIKLKIKKFESQNFTEYQLVQFFLHVSVVSADFEVCVINWQIQIPLRKSIHHKPTPFFHESTNRSTLIYPKLLTIPQPIATFFVNNTLTHILEVIPNQKYLKHENNFFRRNQPMSPSCQTSLRTRRFGFL